LSARQHVADNTKSIRRPQAQTARIWSATAHFTVNSPSPTRHRQKAVRRVRLEDKDGNPVNTIPQAVAMLNKMKGSGRMTT